LCAYTGLGSWCSFSRRSPAQEGLRDLVRCRDDLRRARTAARHRIAKQLLRHGHIYRDGKSWTLRHQAWVAAQRLADPLAHAALEPMLGHLATLDARIAAVDGQLQRVPSREPWAEPVRWLCSFRGIATRTALGLLAEIGDFRRFASPRELMSYLGLTRPSTPRAPSSTAGTPPKPATRTPGSC
jgi:transposase